jgi:hypothetical protein
MFEQITHIKKKLNDPNILCIIFSVVSGIISIDRLIAILKMLLSNSVFSSNWSSIEYTLAFLIPLAGFAYFCSSKYAKNQHNKIKAFVIYSSILSFIAVVMFIQLSNSFIWYIFNSIFNNPIERAINGGFLPRLASAVRAGSFYLPIIFISMSAVMITNAIYGPDSKGKIKSLNIINSTPKMMPVGEFTCEVKVCIDNNSGKDIIIPENRRMEATLIQGATGTGKTSTLMLPMCARDLERKYNFSELSKKLAYEALQKGYAYINVPLSNEEINKDFHLEYLKPVRGKEEELYNLLKDLIKYRNPDTQEIIYKNLGITVVEPDGKYISDFIKVAKNFNINVLTIDPSDPNSYGMNPFVNKSPDKVASIISTVLKGMYESENPGTNNLFFGQVTQQALENLAILLKVMYPRVHNGEIPTLEDMLKMLYDYNIVESMCEEMKKDPALEEEYRILIKYFEKNFYKPPYDINGRAIPGTVGSGRHETEKFLYGATTQLDNLMRHDAVKEILCCRDRNLDFDQVLKKGQCVAVCTRRGELGSLLSKPFGMFYILSMQDAVLRRPGNENSRIPHFLYIDEFPDFVNKETETCFTLFRKYRCAMIVAIQNLAQLARTESMKFYKQVVVSNTKTHLIFGDTNAEDSDYWSEVFGKREVLNVSNSLKTTPLPQVKEGSAGISNESFGMKIGWKDNIKPHSINQLPFKMLYYTCRDAKGDLKKGKSKTDFLEKKYQQPHSDTSYHFDRYVSCIDSNGSVGMFNTIIDQEKQDNEVLIQNTII